MNIIKQTLFALFVILFALLTGCNSNNSNSSDSLTSNKSVREQDSLQLFKLTPKGYTLLDSWLIDLDRDSVKEYVLYFETTTHTECDNTEFNNCFLTELLIAKKVNEQWTEKYRFLLQKPFLTDSITSVFADFDESNLLSITSSFRPTCCSRNTTTQHYHFDEGTFLLDSLNHSVSTTMGSEYYSWEYHIDILQKKCRRTDQYFNPQEDDNGKSATVIFDLKIDKTPTILSKNSIEDFVPEDSLKHWY